MKDDMTLDKLAQMVQQGFESLESRLVERMDTGFTEVNRRFDKVVQPALDNHAQRIKKIEEEVFPH